MRTLSRVLAAALCAGVGVLSIAQTQKAHSPSVSRRGAKAAGWTADSATTVALRGGRELVTGGRDGEQVLSRAVLIGLDGTASQASPMLTARVQHSAVVLRDGRVLVTGGVTAQGTTNTAEIFDPAGNQWSDAGTMAEARASHTMSLLKDGKVLIVGGSSVELYDPADGQFRFAGALSPARSGHAAAVMSDGRVLISGGFDSGTALGFADVYDPATGRVSAVRGSLVVARGGHSATTLHDGRVAIAGGHAEGTDLRSVEIYDPASATFSLAGRELRIARTGHSAELLPKGDRVLIKGGISASNSIAPAEVLDLASSVSAGLESSVRLGSATGTKITSPARLVEDSTTILSRGSGAADLDQCRNGAITSPVPCTDAAWANGNAGASNAHWLEGDSIAYRMKISSVTPGSSHTLTFSWDTTKGGKHAIDYLTTFNRSSSDANPCTGIANCTYAPPPPADANGLGAGTFDAKAIPADPNVTGAGVTPVPGVFTLFGGTITAISPYSVSGSYASDSTTSVAITFTANTATPVLAWGGHIATRTNWGQANSAVAISGSPFHTSLVSLDASGGSQDRSLSNDAVVFPASITIIKDVANGTDPTDFTFTTTGLPTASFQLDDDGTNTNELSNTQVFSMIVDFSTTRTVTESDPLPVFALTALNCSVLSPQQSPSTVGTSVSTRTATFNLKEGESATCTFLNTRQIGSLRVIKSVVNESGGTKAAADFSLHVKNGTTEVSGSPQSGSATGTVYNLLPGTYTVSEDSPTPLGYAQTGFSGDCDGSGAVTVVSGAEKTCTITNHDIAPKLTVIKHVVNDNGGTATASSFTMSVNGISPSPAQFAGAESPGTVVTLKAGSYSVGESGPSGYSASYSTQCSGSIAVGETKTCTVTNDDIGPTLIVIKHVVNDNGGTATASSFTMSVTGNTPSPSQFAGAESPGTSVSLKQGSYSVSESGPGGYNASYSNDCSGTISVGETKTCTVTNDDQGATLIVIKHVINDNGLTSRASDFQITVTGNAPLPAVFAGAESPGTSVNIKQGTYSVEESGPAGYSASQSADCAGTIHLGETKTCTITNNDTQATPSVGTTMSWILNDSATLTGFRSGASDAGTATVTFRLYGPSTSLDCSNALLVDTRTVTGVTSAGPLSPATGIAVTTPGTYRWVAVYSGDQYNAPSSTVCGDETHTIVVGEPNHLMHLRSDQDLAERN